jgi:competence protein ComEA
MAPPDEPRQALSARGDQAGGVIGTSPAGVSAGEPRRVAPTVVDGADRTPTSVTAADEPGPSAAPLTAATVRGGWVPAAARVAADDYARTHPDPDDVEDEEPAPGGVRRPRDQRLRWAVSWRAAGTAALAVSLVVGAVVLRSVALTPGAAVELPEPAPLGAAGSAATDAPRPTVSAGPGLVVVHVVGAVAGPGVVRLPVGSRVLDAVAAAGGATGEADLARLNLARVLVDGEQVAVPGPGDPDPPPEGAPGGGAAGPLDLNTATPAQLDELPGVGPVLAQRIIARRPFTSVDELDEVSGVGPTLLERLRPLVRA